MKEFVYLIKPKRSGFIESMTDEESQVMEIHFQYLKELLAEGKLIMAGPCLDGAFGICVITADSSEDAEKIMLNDPAVANGVMTSELHPYRVSLLKN